jgi:putative ABC transport system permease protein
MTWFSLIRSTLFHHWRANLAVLMGVVAGTAVVTGALIVGDSVRGSLRGMTLARLGGIDHVLTGARFFREHLADDLARSPEFGQRFRDVAPAIIVTCRIERAERSGAGGTTRAGGVTLVAVDDRFRSLIGGGDTFQSPIDDQVVLSRNLAMQLGVSAGDSVVASVELPADIPRDSLLGERDTIAVDVPLVVREVLPDESGISRFGLRPDQQLPRNAFVSLAALPTPCW